MKRCLFIVDHLNPVSPTGACSSLAQSLDVERNDTRVVGIQEFCQGARFCTSSFRRLADTIREFRPTDLYCWGKKSIQYGALAMGLKKKINGRRVNWTAIHVSSRYLLEQHTGFRRLAYSRFDEHLTLNETELPKLGEKYGSWNFRLLPSLWPGFFPTSDPVELRQRLGVPPNARLIGTVAELIPKNRIKDFIWAGDLMTCIRDDVYWLVIGEGWQQRQLERFADHLEIGDHLRFLDWNEDARNIVSGLDVYVQPSAYDDSCLSMVGAMARGVPVVGVSDPLHRRVVQHGVNGFLVERGARNEIARCVNRLINEPQIAARFSKSGTQLYSRLAG